MTTLTLAPAAAMYAHDVMGWVDAADRGLKGQIPNVDYRNAVGPLSSLPLTAGLWIGGSLGAMFPIATAIVAILLMPALAFAISTRLPLLHGAIFALFCLVILIAPLNPGDIMRWMSFAMFYNRWGWVALSIVMVLAIPPKRPSVILDATVLAFLLLFMFYLKVTYATVGLVIILLYAILLPPMRKVAIIALVGALISGVLIEMMWGGTANYLRDLIEAGAQSGALRGGLKQFAGVLVYNVASIAIFLMIFCLAVLRGLRLPYALLSIAMAASAIFLINQSAQLSGLLTFVSAALVCMLAPSKDRPSIAETLAFLALTVPFVAAPIVSLGWHTVLASHEAADPRANLDGIQTPSTWPETPMPLERVEDGYKRGSFSVSDMTRVAAYGMTEGERLYFWSIHDGLDLLRQHAIAGGVTTFDMSNPFNALLGGHPPRGLNIALAENRTLGYARHPSAEELLGDTDAIMVPKFARLVGSTDMLTKIYGGYVQSNFRLVGESAYWQLWVRRSA